MPHPNPKISNPKLIQSFTLPSILTIVFSVVGTQNSKNTSGADTGRTTKQRLWRQGNGGKLKFMDDPEHVKGVTIM